MIGRSSQNERISKKGLSRVAYDAVLDMIFSHQLPGGSIIQERKLAESLGISRTPMREALGKLEGEGLVIRVADRLLSVRVITLEEYLQTLQVRHILEPEAVAMATPRIASSQIQELKERVANLINDPGHSLAKRWAVDAAVHDTLADASGNAVLASVIRQMRTVTHLFEVQTAPGRILPACKDLLTIVEAVEAADVAKARKAINLHLVQARKCVLDELYGGHPPSGNSRKSVAAMRTLVDSAENLIAVASADSVGKIRAARTQRVAGKRNVRSS